MILGRWRCSYCLSARSSLPFPPFGAQWESDEHGVFQESGCGQTRAQSSSWLPRTTSESATLPALSKNHPWHLLHRMEMAQGLHGASQSHTLKGAVQGQY